MLRVQIGVNHIDIAEIQAVRVKGSTSPDSVGTYEVTYLDSDSAQSLGNIQHRYGDGAVKLTEAMARHASENLNLGQGESR